MNVTFDAHFEDGSGSTPASPFSLVSNTAAVPGTIGNNANRVLIGLACFSASVATIGTPTMTWAGQSMALIGAGLDVAGGAYSVFRFGLKAPTTGNQTLSVTFGGAPLNVVIGAVSVYNANQVTGWNNATTNTGTSTAPTLVVTTTSGDMAIAGRVDDNATTPRTVTTGTLDWDEGRFGGNYGGARNPAAGVSTTITWSLGSSVQWGMAGVNVQQAATGTVPRRMTRPFPFKPGSPRMR